MYPICLFIVLVPITKIFCFAIPHDLECIPNNKEFALPKINTIRVTLIYYENQTRCVNDILNHYFNETRLVDVVALKQVKMGFSKQLLKISNQHTVFLFSNGDTIKKFVNEYSVVAYSSSSVHLIAVENCENFEILSEWWTNFKILNLLAYCCATNRLNRYNPFNSSIQQSDFRHIGNLDRPTMNLFGYPLKVNIFYRIPTATPLETIPKTLFEFATYRKLYEMVPYAGSNGFMMAELSRALNFTPLLFAEPKKTVSYGEIFVNGSGIGLLGSLATGRADIAGNGLYVKDYHTDRIEFLVPYTAINVCIIVPKASAIAQWKLVFSCFTKISWGFLFTMLLFLLIVWSCFESFSSETNYGEFFMLQLFLSGSSRQQPIETNKRLLVFTCLFFNIIITNVFQGNLVTSYTKTVFNEDLNTLEDIDKAGLLVSTGMKDLFGYNLTGVRKRLDRKRVETTMERSIHRAAYRRDCCAVERKMDAKFKIESMYVSEDGTPLLHITDACDLSYSIAFAVVRGFPFADSFNRVIMKFVEGGFVDKWNEDVTYTIIVRNRFKRSERGNGAKVLGMKQLQAAFYILAVGITLGFLTFLGELLVKKLF